MKATTESPGALSIVPEQLHSRARPGSQWGRALQFPLLRIITVLLFLTPAAMLHNLLVDYVLSLIEEPLFSYILDIEAVLNFALFMVAYRLYTRIVEKRPALECSAPGAVKETASGFAIGGGLVLFLVGLLVVSRFYQVENTDSPTILLHAFRRFGIGALIQELVFRLILFKILEDWLGSWTAMGLIALIFAALHLGNENATIVTSVALAFEDVLLTAAFMLTRRLWFVWGIHFGWNFLQDGVFGMPNSGETVFPSWIASSVNGPEWLTGGAFGIEASIVTVVLCLLVATPILKAAVKRGKVVAPSWKRTVPQPE